MATLGTSVAAAAVSGGALASTHVTSCRGPCCDGGSYVRLKTVACGEFCARNSTSILSNVESAKHRCWPKKHRWSAVGG